MKAAPGFCAPAALAAVCLPETLGDCGNSGLDAGQARRNLFLMVSDRSVLQAAGLVPADPIYSTLNVVTPHKSRVQGQSG